MINENEIILYTTKDGEIKVDVVYGDQTIWLTQKKMALLFGVQIPAINKHLKNIFASGELVEESVVSILETTAADRKNYTTKLYNLDAIIGVGYRVNSKQATDFRIWATKILKEVTAHPVAGHSLFLAILSGKSTQNAELIWDQ